MAIFTWYSFQDSADNCEPSTAAGRAARGWPEDDPGTLHGAIRRGVGSVNRVDGCWSATRRRALRWGGERGGIPSAQIGAIRDRGDGSGTGSENRQSTSSSHLAIRPQGSIELVGDDLDVIDPLEHHSLLYLPPLHIRPRVGNDRGGRRRFWHCPSAAA